MPAIHPSILLLLATVLWGGNFVIGKAVASTMSPFSLAFLRWCVACVVFLPFVWKALKVDLPLLLKHWKIIGILALTGVAAFNTLIYIGVHDTTSINASLMNMLTPIFIYFLSFLFLKEKLHTYQLLGTLFSFTGVLFIISSGSLNELLQFHFNKGDLIIIGAVLLWSVYSLLIKMFSTTLPGKTTFFASIVVGIVILSPFFIYERFFTATTIIWNNTSIFAVFYTGIFASVIAFLSWNTGVIKYGANRASIYLNFIPVFASLFAVIFLKEQLQWSQLFGGILVVVGIYISSFKNKKV